MNLGARLIDRSKIQTGVSLEMRSKYRHLAGDMRKVFRAGEMRKVLKSVR